MKAFLEVVKMKCPNCQSSNVQSHIITEDKRSRNTKILLCVSLILIVIFFLLSGNNIGAFFISVIVFVMPICMVLKIVLIIIPARKKTLFVCNECGTEFENN